MPPWDREPAGVAAQGLLAVGYQTVAKSRRGGGPRCFGIHGILCSPPVPGQGEAELCPLSEDEAARSMRPRGEPARCYRSPQDGQCDTTLLCSEKAIDP